MAHVGHLFVYGSLQPGQANAELLVRLGGNFVPATVRGTLNNPDWQERGGFPVLRLDEQGPPVRGFVFSSSQLPQAWPMLDAFEGARYRRASAVAELESGQRLAVFTYVDSGESPRSR